MYTIEIGCSCGHSLLRATERSFERYYIGKMLGEYGFEQFRCPECGLWVILSPFETDLISLCKTEYTKYKIARKTAKALANHFFGHEKASLGWAEDALKKPLFDGPGHELKENRE